GSTRKVPTPPTTLRSTMPRNPTERSREPPSPAALRRPASRAGPPSGRFRMSTMAGPDGTPPPPGGTRTAPDATKKGKAALSEGARQERRLGWLLCAPAVIVMVAVTAYPIGYAIYLSLQRYDLRFPARAEFVGLSNYGSVLSSPYWWDAFWVTLFITAVSVAIELVLGMGLALVMHRTLFWRGTVRTAVLIPYGIVTVVAAFSWQYAWTPNLGYLADLLPAGDAPLTE